MPEKHDPSKAPADILSGRGGDIHDTGRENGDVVIVYATFPSVESARVAAQRLVEQRLAACVNILTGMVAVYAWEGTLHQDEEVVALIKTRRALSEAVVRAVCERHPYDNPAALVIEVSGGAKPYLDWLASATSQSWA